MTSKTIPGGTYKKTRVHCMCLPHGVTGVPGKSNQFENWRFLYLRETKSWRCEEEGEGGGEEEEEETFHLKTHAPLGGDCG